MADDRILQFLTGLTVLLFVSSLVLPRGGHWRVTWLRWGALAAFAVAVAYALWLTLLWALHRP